MDGHLEWALKRNDNRTEMKKEELDDNVGRIIAQQRKVETEAQAEGRKIQERILFQLNKKVAGRVESIAKVESYLNQQQKWEEEELAREEAEKAAELLAAEEDESEPETPVFQRIEK